MFSEIEKFKKHLWRQKRLTLARTATTPATCGSSSPGWISPPAISRLDLAAGGELEWNRFRG